MEAPPRIAAYRAAMQMDNVAKPPEERISNLQVVAAAGIAPVALKLKVACLRYFRRMLSVAPKSLLILLQAASSYSVHTWMHTVLSELWQLSAYAGPKHPLRSAPCPTLDPGFWLRYFRTEGYGYDSLIAAMTVDATNAYLSYVQQLVDAAIATEPVLKVGFPCSCCDAEFGDSQQLHPTCTVCTE